MNFAIIGCGFIFSRHVDAIRDTGGQVLATCDIDPEKGADFLDYKKMLDDPIMDQVDAVVICTPNHLHKQMIIDSLAKGKKVLCEKPMIIDDDFSQLGDVKSVLQLRYHKLVPDLRVALAKKKNKVELIMKVYRDEKWWNSWRGKEEESGGILIGLGVHMMDMLIFLLGNEYKIKEVYNSRKMCCGKISFPAALVEYYVKVMDKRVGQTRKFIINRQNFELCSADNLSFAGYHDMVYIDFINGFGVGVEEARKSIEMINRIKALGNNAFVK